MNKGYRIVTILGALALLAVLGAVLWQPVMMGLAQFRSPLETPVPASARSPLQTLPPGWESTQPPLPPPPTSTPRITPTPPSPALAAEVAAYDARIPLRAERVTLAAVQPFAVGNPITFKAWSPDGTRFLFGRSNQRYILVQFEDGAAANGFWDDLWVANADGSQAQKLADIANDWAWSPDGRSLAYLTPVSEQGIEGALYVVNVERPRPRKIADCDLGGLDDVAWLPTGEITCRRNGVMYAVRSNGSQMRQLNNIFTSDFVTDPLTEETLPPVFQGDYHVSPDGKKLAYIRIGLPSSLWISELDGSNTAEVRVNPYVSYDWAWSPDSSMIAFSVPNGQGRLGTDLWIVNANGSNRRRVTVTEREDAICMGPTWSPDSQVIAYTYRANTMSQPESVWVVNADGTNPHLLVDLAFDPQWSAKGNQIAVLRLRSLTDNPETFLVQVALGQR